MPFWEKNVVVIGTASLITGCVYFGWLIINWIASGQIPDPSLLVILTCLALQITLAVSGILIFNVQGAKANSSDIPPKGQDERDRLINMKTEAQAGHLYYLLIFATILGWFIHDSASLLVHSLIGAFLVGDLFRCGLQVFNYNRAY